MLGFALALLATLVHAALIFAGAPLLVGLADKLRARLLGRRGAPITQPYVILRKLLAKVPVVPDNASELYRVWPFVCLAATAAAAALTPGFCFGMASARQGDFITFIGLLGIGRAATVLAGLETGFGFGGAGAGRAVLFSLFGEAALLLVVLTLALCGHAVTIDGIGSFLRRGHAGLSVPLGLALLAILAVALVENGRAPADDPAGQQEPAMVRSAMLLEYSGRFLALLEYAAMLRLALWLSLIGAIFLPFGMAEARTLPSWPLGLVSWAIKLTVLIGALALFEGFIGRVRVLQVPAFLASATLLGFLAIVFLFVSRGFGA